MIRVILTGPGFRRAPDRKTIFPYIIRNAGATHEVLQGFSSSPLLDACRRLHRLGIAPGAEIGLFDLGQYRDQYRVKTTVGFGAMMRVKDDDAKSPPRLVPYDADQDPSALRAKLAAQPRQRSRSPKPKPDTDQAA